MYVGVPACAESAAEESARAPVDENNRSPSKHAHRGGLDEDGSTMVFDISYTTCKPTADCKSVSSEQKSKVSVYRGTSTMAECWWSKSAEVSLGFA